MSITLGDYYVETKKTVGDLPVGSDNIITETPCEEVIDDATVQPKWKKIHEYSTSINALPAGVGLFEIPPIYVPLNDDVFADGYDYEVEITLNYVGASPLLNNYLQRFSYTVGGVGWFQNVVTGDKIIMNEVNCGGSYANTQRALNIGANDTSPFILQIDFSIKQLIPATIEIELCGGGTTINLTELKEITEVISVFVEESEEPINVGSTKRQTPYDPYGGGFSEIAKLPKTCLGYSVYYVGSLFSSPFVSSDKTYYLDSGIYEVKINIPKTPPQALDFKLWDGVSYYFAGPSDANGLLDWTALDGTAPAADFNMTLEIWEPILNVQETSSA